MASIYLIQNEWFQSPALGDVDMGGNTIENLAAPVDASDAVTKQYADSLAGGINPSQWSMFPAVNDVNMNISTITNLKPPVNIGDAANKGYCDSTASAAASAASALWASSPASQDLNMNVSSIYNIKQISNTSGLILSGTNDYSDLNHRITIATSGISVNSVNMTGNVNINGGQHTTVKANASAFQTDGILTLNNKTNSAYLTSSGFGLGTSTPTAKLEVVQDAAVDCLRVLDSNSDTTYFKIDSNGYVGVGMGSAALTYPFNVAGKALLIDNVAPNPELIFSGSVAGVDCLASVTARNGSLTDRSLQFYNAKNIGSSNAAFSFIGGDGTTNPAFQLLGNRNAICYGSADAQNYTISGNGSYKGANNINALPANTEYPIITAGDGVGIWGKKLANNNMEALLFKTHYISGSPGTSISITQYGDIGMGPFSSTDDIRAKLHVLNVGSFDSFRVDDQTSDTTYFKIDASGLCGVLTGSNALSSAFTVNGVVDVMSNKIINVGTPTNSNDAANKAYVDSASGGSSWSQYPANQTINANYQKISNVANPVDAYDVATRAYVDQQLIPTLPQSREYYVTGTTTIDLTENYNYEDICITIHCTSNISISFTHDTDFNLRGQKLMIFLTTDSSYTNTVTINSPGGGTVSLKNGTLSSVMYVCGLRSGSNYWRLAYSVL